VIFAGISSTISFTNLLITRRTLAMPGLRNRRVLMPFVTVALLLSLRMLVLITPVLAAAMFMVLADRH
jgi:heme/copper-type cytochrome/quinol oxidase subunit 1